MKKIILSFSFALLGILTTVQAQVPRELVLVEIGTGGWCTYCPGAAMGADDLHANGDPVAIIENHNGDPYATTMSNGRNSYYGITGYPTAWFDGRNPVVGGSHTTSMYPQYISRVNSRMTVPTSFLLDITGSSDGDNYSINVNIEKVADYQTENIVLRFVLTESDIQYNWQGQTEMNFVSRIMMPDLNGTPITMATGESLDVPLTFTFNNTWVKDNCELIAWVQNNTTKEVMHCAKIMVNDLDLGMAADFSADVTSGCGPTEVNFQNLSIGEDLTYTWVFPGGSPEFSFDENPTITYNTEGSYGVTLTIDNGTETMTVSKENFITIHPDLAVSFAEVPVLCVEDGSPYELIEGSPVGGVYTGTGVVDGYFDPVAVGAGTYEVTYTYTDPEFGCSKSATQLVSVDECTGINEQVNGISLSILPNPTEGRFVVNMNSDVTKAVSIRVMNSLGKVIYQNNSLNVTGNMAQSIDLSNESYGVYYVQIESEGKTFNKKILVK